MTGVQTCALPIYELKSISPQHILDVATGTGDVAIMASRKLNPEKITGIDISKGMLEIGRKKIEKLNLQNKIELMLGDSEAIKYPDHTFDAVTVPGITAQATPLQR